jgi:hypothetical protein
MSAQNECSARICSDGMVTYQRKLRGMGRREGLAEEVFKQSAWESARYGRGEGGGTVVAAIIR